MAGQSEVQFVVISSKVTLPSPGFSSWGHGFGSQGGLNSEQTSSRKTLLNDPFGKRGFAYILICALFWDAVL